MTDHIPGPVFMKASGKGRRHSSLSSITEGNALVNDVLLQQSIESADVPSKTKLRLVRLETAEKEACKYIRDLCIEACEILDAKDTEIDIRDMLTGILLLANFYKKISNSKRNLEEKLELLQKDFNNLEKSHAVTVSNPCNC